MCQISEKLMTQITKNPADEPPKKRLKTNHLHNSHVKSMGQLQLTGLSVLKTFSGFFAWFVRIRYDMQKPYLKC